MRHPRALRRLLIASAAAVGLVVGHLLDYLVVAPDPEHRRALLHLTGHGYFESASSAVVILVLAITLSMLCAGFVARPAESALVSWRHVAPRMAALQTAGFVVLETGERIAAGASWGELGPILALGVFVQLAVAAVAALALVLLERGGRVLAALTARRRSPRRAPLRIAFAATSDNWIARLDVARLFCRGPPRGFLLPVNP